MTEHTERRSGNKEIADKIDALVGMLTIHMSREEIELQEVKSTIEKYFKDLEAHIHVKHHEFVAEEIQKEEKAEARWEKVWAEVMSKGLIFVFGAIMSYLVTLVTNDIKTPAPPAVQMHQQVQQPPQNAKLPPMP